MATDVILPALGMAQDTGKIVEWLKAEGEQVSAGEPLVTIETDKAAVDLEAPASGILARVSASPGEEVPVAQVIAVILSPEEAGQDTNHASPAPAPAPAPAVAPPARLELATSPAPQASPAPGRTGRRAASPKARRIAAERGLDFAAIQGTGPGGVVLAADVFAARTGATGPALAGAATAPAPVAAAAPEMADGAAREPAHSPVSTVWRLMAERTTQSWTSVPHYFLLREVDAMQLVAWRERAARQVADTVTFTDLLTKVVAEALRRHPRLNATWANNTIALHEKIHIGIAVATEHGLVVPVLHDADELSLRGIARQRAELVARAQAGRLQPRDVQGGTFTISNLGMYGIDAFTAIINAPQAAILAVGRIAERVVPVAGQPVVRPMLTLSLSCDHRAVDGAHGAAFLATVAELIEQPSELAG